MVRFYFGQNKKSPAIADPAFLKSYEVKKVWKYRESLWESLSRKKELGLQVVLATEIISRLVKSETSM